MIQGDRIAGGLWGALIGDALGVPVEFINRTAIQADPVISMREYGTHYQPKGTWSDDGALILCAIDSLLHHEFNLPDMGERFVRWVKDGFWTANGDVFDVGHTTRMALDRIAKGVSPEQAGGRTEDSNGNGSLMRILPIALRFASEPIDLFADRLERASAMTHGHSRSRMACVFYGLVVRQLLLEDRPAAAIGVARKTFIEWYQTAPEFPHFRPVLEDNLLALPEGRIISTGYVLHTLHASLWCLLTTQNFRDCVLRAVNLGGDTDTTGCVAGGLAGVAYGIDSLSAEWRRQLARDAEVKKLIERFIVTCEMSALGKR